MTTHASHPAPWRLRLTALIALMFTALAGPAAATEIEVAGGWIRLAPPGAMMLAGYAELRNRGDAPVRIVGASTEAFATAEFHRTVDEDGVSRMRAAGALEIAPGATLALAPGGLHLMLMQPRSELPAGRTVVVDLLTEQGEVVPAVFTVRRGE